MEKLLRILLILLLISKLVFNANAQLNKADSYFDNLAYIQAIKYYEKASNKDPENHHIIKRLGESYRFVKNMEAAETWYSKLVYFPDSEPIDYYYYAQILKSNEKYDEALIWIEKYYHLTNSEWAKKHISDKNYYIRLKENLQGYQIYNLLANSEEADFGPSFNKDNIVFSSSRNSKASSHQIYPWNGQPYLELYIAKIRDDGELINVEDFVKDINSTYHEGPATFSQNDNIIYFTRNSWKNEHGINGEKNLKVFEATINDNKWENIKSMPFNSDDYSCGHPSIAADGSRLYFISNMPVGYGGTDIYYCDKYGDEWSEPINAGFYINTEGNEMFPFIYENGTLYFSSDGHLGLGGLDVFAAIEKTPDVYDITNLGYPINSPKDDFGFIVNKGGDNGYFSSNRPGGIGDDDIYRFNKTSLKLIGDVKDQSDNELLENVQITLVNIEGIELDTYTTGENGAFEFNIASGKDYKLHFEKEGYVKSDSEIKGNKEIKSGIIESDFSLMKTDFSFNLNEAVRLNDIYYDLNSYNVRSESKQELNKLVKILREYPEIIIEICSHTDSRADDVYNYWLSQQRAIAVAEYIISQGIDKSRVTGKGYGETKLLNHCSNGVNCSEFEHQENRRTEFKVIGYVKSSGLNLYADNIKNIEDDSGDNIPEFLSAYLNGDYSVIQDKHGSLNDFYASNSMEEKNNASNPYDTVKYSLVAGSFREIEMAKKYMIRLNSKGYTCQILPINGFYRVIIDSGESLDEASNKLNIAKKDLNKDVWIMKHF